MTPGKDGNGFFFKFEILPTNIDQSQILKNICQQLLSLNNILKRRNDVTTIVKLYREYLPLALILHTKLDYACEVISIFRINIIIE